MLEILELKMLRQFFFLPKTHQLCETNCSQRDLETSRIHFKLQHNKFVRHSFNLYQNELKCNSVCMHNCQCYNSFKLTHKFLPVSCSVRSLPRTTDSPLGSISIPSHSLSRICSYVCAPS